MSLGNSNGAHFSGYRTSAGPADASAASQASDEQEKVNLSDIVPGGILPGDRAHSAADDGSCSRCGEKDDEDVALLLWLRDSDVTWRYCSGCMGWKPGAAS